MNERDYHRARKDVQRECEESLRALEKAWRIINKSPPPKDATAAKPVRSTTAPKASVVGAVVDVLASMGDANFTTADMYRLVHKLHPEINGDADRSSISHALKRMAKDEKLVIVEKGAGKKPTTWRRNGSTPSPVGIEDL